MWWDARIWYWLTYYNPDYGEDLEEDHIIVYTKN